MDARQGLAAILRDAVLRTAPQDEGFISSHALLMCSHGIAQQASEDATGG
jgi:hypothetical protein